MSARSLYGCWTCRVRRKKCDENRPSCFECGSLELQCHGYGPRPVWMDNGLLQKSEALKVKQTISRTRLNRRRRQSLSKARSSENPSSERNSRPNGSVSSPILPLPSPTCMTVEVLENTPQGNSLSQSSEQDLRAPSETIWTELPSNVDTSIEFSFIQGESVPIAHQHLCYGDSNIEEVDVESVSQSFTYSEEISVLTPISPTTREADGGWYNSAFEDDFQFEVDTEALVGFCEPTISSSSFSQNMFVSTSKASGHFASWPTATDQSSLCADTEDMLFMNYLDQVFHIQYPFYHSSYRYGRGWLFSIIRRVRPAYHAALALSEHLLCATITQNSSIASSPDHLGVKSGHYDLALREMQLTIAQSRAWTGSLGLLRSIESLTCILQLLFRELFCGGTENWQTHLRAAATLIPALLQAQTALSTSKVSGFGNGQPDKTTLHSEDDTAIRFLLGSFIYFDIISCVSTRSSLFLEVNHKLLLERGGLNLESLTGCKDWAMAFILEISQLDKWKKETEKANKLSVVELAKRGGRIEDRLRKKLVDIESESSKGISPQNPGGTVSWSIAAEVTKIFAFSAMTYLHVVISGALPELPEITRSVSQTIIAFQSLTDPKLLRNLVWPFCVTGCLAPERQRAAFRQLISAAEITQATVGTCLEAFKIIEKCWEVRKTTSQKCDWVSIMEKLGHYILLG